jgi:cell division septum initiation protein DivIVA
LQGRHLPSTIELMAPDDSSGGAREGGEGGEQSRLLPSSFRGYDRAATDRLLSELRAKHDELAQECGRLRTRVTSLEGEVAGHREQEHVVSATLLAATRQAAAIKEEAQREMDLVLQDSRAELERQTAHIQQLESECADAEHELQRLRGLTQDLETGLASLLTQALGDLRTDRLTSPADPEATEAGQSLVDALGATVKDEASAQVAEHSVEPAPPTA